MASDEGTALVTVSIAELAAATVEALTSSSLVLTVSVVELLPPAISDEFCLGVDAMGELYEGGASSRIDLAGVLIAAAAPDAEGVELCDELCAGKKLTRIFFS
jgi:hypothetical protein